MNTSDDNPEPSKFDEYQDRLIDLGLSELIGNETPPDLSSRILSTVTASKPTPAASASSRRFVASRRLAAAVAASLLLGCTFLLLPKVQTARETAKTSVPKAKNARLGSAASKPALSENAPQVVTDGLVDRGLSELTTNFNSLGQTHPDAKEYDGLQDLVKNTSAKTLPPGFRSGSESQPPPQASVAFEFERPKQLAQLGAIVQSSSGSALEQRYVTELEHSIEGGYGRGGYGQRGYGIGGEFIKERAEGIGPDLSGDQYTRIVENPFIKAEGANAVSTFSIDVDTASYANVRQFLLGMNTLPPPDAVRIEELINYFQYDYAGPKDNATDTAAADAPPGSDEAAAAPFAAHVEVAGCPWRPEHRLVRIGIKGRELERDKRPRSNLVFLVDVSGSMNEPNKLPLVVYGLEQLTRELGENDRVAIVVYASSEGLVLPSTSGSDQQAILTALGQLQAGGSTAGGAGIQLAYQIAEDNFIEGGTNRVILCTDGDFNVGVTSTAELERMCQQKAKDTGVFLSVLGFGRGNLNDAMMEAIADHGNGNYHYVDNRTEARRVLVEEMTGTLITIAKDVKIQVEFNPHQVAGYRLIGYENRMLRREDFNDDTKDAGEIGAGHTVTALYEVVPAGQKVDVTPVDELKYQASTVEPQDPNESVNGELLTLKMRYKQPDGDTSRKLEWAVSDEGKSYRAASADFQFAAAVAGFGLLLRDSQYKGNLTYAAVLELAQSGIGQDQHGYRAEFLELARRAKALRGE
jgi:Ca-activated chloride channel family protein